MLKGTRQLLVKNPENLEPGSDERDRLQEALSLNKPMAMAYYVKEELRFLWHLSGEAAGRLTLTIGSASPKHPAS